MTISSLSQIYSSYINNTGPSNGASTVSATSTDNQLLSTMINLPSTTQQNLASLTTLSSSQSNSVPQTYTAQGLLQQIQSSMLSNDAMLMPDSTSSSDNSISDSILQGLLSSSQSALPSSVNNQNSQISSSPSSVDLNSNWTTVLKQDPAMAPALVQNEMNQSLMSTLGQ